MWEPFKLTFWALFPSREPFETNRFLIWRFVIAGVALISFGAIMMNYALAFGAISLFGFTGFAQASEVTALVTQQNQQFAQLSRKSDDIMVVVIGGQISDSRFRQCAAIKSGNQDAIRSLSDELQRGLDAYQGFKGQRYNLQACP